MNSRRAATATVMGIVTVTVAVVSACSGAVDGTPIASPAGVAEAALETVNGYTWADVSDTAPVTGDFRLGTTPLPGVGILHRELDGRYICSLGPAVSGSSGAGFITAGHCFGSEAGAQTMTDCHACTEVPMGALQSPTSRTLSTQKDQRDGMVTDSGFIPHAVTADVTKVGGHPIAGVLTVDGVKNLPPRTEVCIDGAVSGVVCRTIQDTGSGDIHTNGAIGVPGDSGAAAFVVDQTTHRAALVGVAWGTDRIAFLDPALERLGVTALLASGIDPFPTGRDFSARTQTFK